MLITALSIAQNFLSKEDLVMENNNSNSTKSEQSTLDFWKMKNMSTCEYDSAMGNSAWSEWDKVTGADSKDD